MVIYLLSRSNDLLVFALVLRYILRTRADISDVVGTSTDLDITRTHDPSRVQVIISIDGLFCIHDTVCLPGPS